MAFLMLLAGLGLLIAGGEALVRGAAQLAKRMGVSPMLIGITLVGLGTSAPELVASVKAAMAGAPGMAIGNYVGSNIANLLLILGVAALVSPIQVARGTLARDGGLGFFAALMLLAAAMTIGLGPIVGASFILILAGYLAYAYYEELKDAPRHSAAFDRSVAHEGVAAPGGASLFQSIAYFALGLAGIILGGNWLVTAAIALASSFGVSDTMIGLTVVAIGTSMPELVTSVIAARKGESEVALGNVLGSNIYNILFIGGTVAVIAPTAAPPEMIRFDMPVLIAVTVLTIVFATTGKRIGRREGAALLALYLAYTAFVVLRA